MPCSGCAKRRKAILDAWQRVRRLGLMRNDRDHERSATMLRNAAREQIRQRQQELKRLVQGGYTGPSAIGRPRPPTTGSGVR